MFTGFIHDLADRIIAETDAAGNKQREYIWADDIPIAVVGNVASAPALWFVHTDHLLRPVRMTDANGFVVWDAVFRPFGEVHSITGAASNDRRFPGQWFQLQNGLAYNWHRHYDASLGRYVSADPYNHLAGIARKTPRSISGNISALHPQRSSTAAYDQNSLPLSGRNNSNAVHAQRESLPFPDGPNLYNYARQRPVSRIDKGGLVSESLPLQGPPGGVLIKPGCQIRVYDQNGKPFCDIDLNHDHGAGCPHIHFWAGPAVRLPALPIPEIYK